MSDGNGLRPVGHSLSGRNIMNSVEHLRIIIPVSAPVADADRHIFQDDESIFVLE